MRMREALFALCVSLVINSYPRIVLVFQSLKKREPYPPTFRASKAGTLVRAPRDVNLITT